MRERLEFAKINGFPVDVVETDSSQVFSAITDNQISINVEPLALDVCNLLADTDGGKYYLLPEMEIA